MAIETEIPTTISVPRETVNLARSPPPPLRQDLTDEAINAKEDEVGGRWISAGEDSRWEISTTA